ncbi:MAG TPA: sigma-54 dependent transcriptional regulator [Gammaproteobacteria bacterium]
MSESAAPLALIVDDEPDIRELLAITLSRMGISSEAAASLAEARAHLASQRFALCLTDMRLPDGSGIEVIRHIQQTQPALPVAMITAHGNMQSAIEALKAGAFDFINKPVELQTLRELVNTALQLNQSPADKSGSQTLSLLGQSPVIETIRATVAKLARSQAPVYISGESGTGKELVARLIHQLGPRADKTFVPVNCGAIPAELMESELFGYKKGSFTGAANDKAGLFQAAHGGTLFLDEVADLPLAMQVKLLRAIQEKAVRPVGAQQETHVDVRILSATHKDLGALVRDGRFREDLFYRINVIELHVPGLRERTSDIPLLVDHFLKYHAHNMGVTTPVLDDAAMDRLKGYSFPGNVRELENILDRAVTLCDSGVIHASDLHLPNHDSSDQNSGDEGEIDEGFNLETYLTAIEKRAITEALEKSDYNKTAAAKLLGISFRALRYRLKKLEMD